MAWGTLRYASRKPSAFPALLGSSQTSCTLVELSTLMKKVGGAGTGGRIPGISDDDDDDDDQRQKLHFNAAAAFLLLKGSNISFRELFEWVVLETLPPPSVVETTVRDC